MHLSIIADNRINRSSAVPVRHRNAPLCACLHIVALALCGMLFAPAPNAVAAESEQSLMRDDFRGGWQIFGYAAMDSAANVLDKEVLVDVDWSRATWGVGAMHTLKKPIDGRKLKAIRADIMTINGSRPTVHCGIATSADASLEAYRRDAVTISDSWTSVSFAIADMRKAKPELTSPAFTRANWKDIQVVKFLISKPESTEIALDKILIRNPVLVFE